MAKRRISDNWFAGAFQIFFHSIKYYLLNFETFLKMLAFPIFGQLIGLFLIFTVNYFFIMNIPQLAKNIPLFNNITFVFTILILCILPCFLIFAKAFFDYILAMASLNLMANHVISSGQLSDTEIHKDMVKTRLGMYFCLLLVLTIIFLLLSFPLFWILLIPVCILLSLTIQAFVLEDNISPFKAISRSYLFVRYNFFKTTLLLILLGILCYCFLPQLFNWAFEKTNLHIFISSPIDLYVNLLPINDINALLAKFPIGSVKLEIIPHEISLSIIQSFVSFVVICFTLPIRAIACTYLYINLRDNNITQDDTQIKKIVKRATDK